MAKPLTIQQIEALTSNVNAHKADKNNPHGVTAALTGAYSKSQTMSAAEINAAIATAIAENSGSFISDSVVLTSSGVWTPPNIRYCLGVLIGGGAGGGASGLAYSISTGGNGGAGGSGETIFVILNVEGVSSLPYTIGGAGAGGVTSRSNGTAGGSTELTLDSFVYKASGGNGGAGGTNGNTSGSAPGASGRAGTGGLDAYPITGSGLYAGRTSIYGLDGNYGRGGNGGAGVLGGFNKGADGNKGVIMLFW